MQNATNESMTKAQPSNSGVVEEAIELDLVVDGDEVAIVDEVHYSDEATPKVLGAQTSSQALYILPIWCGKIKEVAENQSQTMVAWHRRKRRFLPWAKQLRSRFKPNAYP